MEDHTIYASRGERAHQRTVAMEVDAFQNSFRLSNTADDVVAMCLEEIGSMQSVHAATCWRSFRPRDAGRAQHHCGNNADQRTREQ